MQAEHIAGEFGYVLLRLVDCLQALLQFAKRMRGASTRAFEVFVEGLRDIGQPLLHQLQHFGLAGGLQLRHMGQAAG